MALDGGYLRHICYEIKEQAINSRVEKVYQPNKDELILVLRGMGGQKKLLLSARANSPRINFTQFAPENPKVPPMFCMLLRKRLAGAKLRQIIQPQMERLLFLEFDAKSDLGDPIVLTLVVEIMGKYSNVIFIDSENKVIDALKRVDMTMSSLRLVLPGLAYQMPPVQDKINLLEHGAKEVIARIQQDEADKPLSKALLSHIQGVSPIVCRQIEHNTACGKELTVKMMDSQDVSRLEAQLTQLAQTIEEGSGTPYMVIADGKPLDFSFIDISQYGTAAQIKKYDYFSELLDSFYQERDMADRMRVKAQDLHRLVLNMTERLAKKINTQTGELKQCVNREPLRINGDLLQANLYRIQKGISEIEVENFYDENRPIVILLNPALSPTQNAQKYYKDYRKAKTAQQVLQVQIEKAKQDLEYMHSVYDSLSRAKTEEELNEIRNELTEQGYLKAPRGKVKKNTALPPFSFESESGFKILVGRNNRQNDKLTLSQAKKNDLWFHTKEIPGSHTVIVTEGKTPDEDTILFAAQLAAFHSKAKDSAQVPVDFTQIRNVSKSQGAKPGMVIYMKNKTLYVSPANVQQAKG